MRSLTNRHLDLRNVDFALEAALNLRWRSCFKKQLDSLSQIGAGFADAAALARNIEFGKQRDEAVVLA